MAYKALDVSCPTSPKSYDSLGRIVRREQPDGTFTRVEHRPLVQLLFDEENTNPASPHHNLPRTLTFDELEWMVMVEEANKVNGQIERHTTRYSYDSLGNLTEMLDSHGNIKRQSFDALNRKVSIDDLDRGTAHFIHDYNGNVIESVDAKQGAAGALQLRCC